MHMQHTKRTTHTSTRALLAQTSELGPARGPLRRLPLVWALISHTACSVRLLACRCVIAATASPPPHSCAYAMGRSSFGRAWPPRSAHGRTPGRALAGAYGAARRGARRVVRQAVSTMGVEHVRWVSARQASLPPRPLRLLRRRLSLTRRSWGSWPVCHSWSLTWVRRVRPPRPSAPDSSPDAMY